VPGKLTKKRSIGGICSLIICGLLCGTIAGCGSKNNFVPASSSTKKMTVGFAMATLKEDRWLHDRDIFSAKAKQENIDVIVTNANNDINEQYRQVKSMIDRGIDLLVIVPQDCERSAICVQLANKGGIPVISYDRLVRNCKVDAYVSFDNVKVGQLQAEELLKKVPTGGYLILDGAKSDNNSAMYHQGYFDKLQPSIENGKIQIVAETWVQDWLRENAYSFVSDQLTHHAGQINAILAANDSLAWGAIDALSEAKLTKKVIVVGHDADLAACQRIVDGTQDLTIYKQIDKLVDKTVEICTILAQKQKISYKQTINNGAYDVPYLMCDVIPVTKDNIDVTVIKDGFQLKEDVYRTSK
jgi:D-xylose transport system substrate-binding protein